MQKQKGLARLATAKGFTIIELIVVIAIIAILAAIVMVNVTQYINKAKTSAIIADMDGIPTLAVQWFTDDTNEQNGNAFVSSHPFPGATYIDNIGWTIGGAVVNIGWIGSTDSQDWCIQTDPLPGYADGVAYCVDSVGYKGFVYYGSAGDDHPCGWGGAHSCKN